MHWSEEVFRIFECERAMTPTLEFVLQRIRLDERAHPGDPACMRQALAQAAQREKDLRFEHRSLLPDGRVKHVRIFSRAWQNSSGNPDFVGL